MTFIAPPVGSFRGAHQAPRPTQQDTAPFSAGWVSMPLNCAAIGAGILAGASARRVPPGRCAHGSRARACVVPPSARAAVIGDHIPAIALDRGFPPEKVVLSDFCKGKKVVLVGLPGAFTPT
uniref:Uncharacterized protein n=1 Tax=Noctiluca scintillans TaxID=2966 RepID=A0A7S1FDF5_NOCSC|mmetsp:Transcript_5528/g.15880  ORF Transcript_5528/g.15880 Transcript_5528/m.15880 type:complete len:122 (+) Transcript_5528:1-366(+)